MTTSWRSRRGRHVYGGMLGAAIGALLTGLVLPMSLDPSDDARLATGGSPASVASGSSFGSGEPGARATTDQPGTATTAAVRPGDAGVAQGGGGGASEPTVGASAVNEVGVKPDAVTVGALLFDLGGVGRLGFGAPGADAPQQRRFYEAFIADVNDAGGVGGRQVVPVFESFDPTNGDDQRRACTAMTEDAGSFVVLSAGGFFGDPVLCITEQHGVPLIGGQGEADEYYQRSRGLLFTPEMSATRMARTMARRAHAQGRLKDHTIGVLTNEDPQSRLPAENGLIPEVRALGYTVAHVTTLSQDPSTASSQMPVEIAEMRRKGVDLILVSTNGVLAALWFNQAEGQRYDAEYILSDIASASNDFTVQSAPSDLRAIAYTVMRQGESRTNRPQQPEGADCQSRYRRRTGQLVEQGTSGYDQLTAICGTVSTFVRAADAAGTELTRTRFVANMQGVGAFAFPDIGGTISFGPGKFDGADFVRTKEYDAECRCWIPVDDFAPAG